MVEGAASVVEIVIAIAKSIADLAALVLVASIRPWRFALSPEYRTKVVAELEGRHPFYRVVYFAWGSVTLVASIIVVAGIWWFFASQPARESPPPSRVSDKVHHLKEKASELKERLGR